MSEPMSLPYFFTDSDGLLQPSARRRRARLYRRRYRFLRRTVVALPLLVAAIGLGAYVANEHAWRQRTAEQAVEVAMLRVRVEALQGALAGSKVTMEGAR